MRGFAEVVGILIVFVAIGVGLTRLLTVVAKGMAAKKANTKTNEDDDEPV